MSPAISHDDRAATGLARLVDSATDAVVAIDAQQRVVLYNAAAERIFGRPLKEVRGQSLSMLIPQGLSQLNAQETQPGGLSSAPLLTHRSCLSHGVRFSGEEFPIEASISQIDTPEGPLSMLILRSVSEPEDIEQDPQRLAARLAGLIESAMDAIITVDAKQRITLYNPAAEKIFGWAAADVLGRPLDILIPARFREEHGAHVRRFGETGVTSRRMGGSSLIYGLRSNGEEFPLEASISQLEAPEGKVFTVILRDVTARMRAQEELASFAAEASGIREQEKSRIARELHDELAQSLTALKMDTIWLRDNPLADPAVAVAKLNEMLSLLDTSVAATRRIAADLRPLVLDDLGLVPAIEWLAHNFTQRTGVPCVLELDQDIELQEPHATGVFRIVQESLVNVAKHAQASRVRVRVAREDDVMTLSVEDNGRGFRVNDRRKPQSLGLVGLRERAYLMQGTVQVSSEPGQGTRVQARIPFARGDWA